MCNLDSKAVSYLWREDVADLYSDQTTSPDYVADFFHAMRPVYAHPDLVLQDILKPAEKVNSFTISW